MRVQYWDYASTQASCVNAQERTQRLHDFQTSQNRRVLLFHLDKTRMRGLYVAVTVVTGIDLTHKC